MHQAQLQSQKEVDVAWQAPNVGRIRASVFRQRGTFAIVMRVIANTIPSLADLKLPARLSEIAALKNGVVLVTGPTGSGKSSTLAAIIDLINENRAEHILTIEDPIEFVYTEDKALINQREVGVDVADFKIAMKHAVRQDPDIMLVGEMRDMETFETAMHAAETGHLVFGTIHASSAPSTIGRILDLFRCAAEDFGQSACRHR
jgi:twitching motility protein PilT